MPFLSAKKNHYKMFIEIYFLLPHICVHIHTLIIIINYNDLKRIFADKLDPTKFTTNLLRFVK